MNIVEYNMMHLNMSTLMILLEKTDVCVDIKGEMETKMNQLVDGINDRSIIYEDDAIGYNSIKISLLASLACFYYI